MAIRRRTSKIVARRHDLNYFKYTPSLRRWQWRLTLIAVGIAIVWVSASGLRHGAMMFASGPPSTAHAVFIQHCETCHLDMKPGQMSKVSFRKNVPDHACLQCHVAPAHQENATFTPGCASCHTEHIGSQHLTAMADSNCTQCHGDLRTVHGAAQFAAAIHSFTHGHPEFASVRPGVRDASNIIFSHAAHMDPKLLGPDGKTQARLGCGDCHQTPAVAQGTKWRFGEPAEKQDETPKSVALLKLTDFAGPQAGRARMAPVEFDQNCRSCHTLQFDKHIAAQAPHASQQVVHAFVLARITQFAEQHPDTVRQEIDAWKTHDEVLPEQAAIPAPRNQEEWIAAQTRRSEKILWGEKCNLCHEVSRIVEDPAEPAALPVIAPTHQKSPWFEHAIFRHDAHQAVTCESCHSAALTSTNGFDVLVPGIATCQRCHNGLVRIVAQNASAGHAQSGCFECHQYHNWKSGMEGTPQHTFTIEQLSRLNPRAADQQNLSALELPAVLAAHR